MIEIKNLVKTFGTKEVLKGVNLEIKEGKTTVVLGLSGSGKSTIIRHIVGLLRPTSGDIFVDGANVSKMSEKELFEVRKKVGFLFQSGALFDSMNVEDNIAFPLKEHTNYSKKQMKDEFFKRLEMVGLKQDVARLFPHELSGGMRKRVGLARTIILNPKVVLYDEPTSGLDPITSDLITTMMTNLKNELNTTSVLISHDIKESFKASDYMAMLYDGKIIEYGSKERFKEVSNPYVKQLLAGSSEGVIKLK